MALFDQTEQELVRLLRKEYYQLSQSVLDRLKGLYDELKAKGAMTADMLYRQDKFYRLLNDLQQKLDILAEVEKTHFTTSFESYYKANFKMIDDAGTKAKYQEISNEKVLRAANSFRPGDGKNFSDRIWTSKRVLLEKLQAGMVSVVATGQSWSVLSKDIKKTFSVAFSEARRLVRTELANMMAQSTLDRYRSEGVKEVRWLCNPDEAKVCTACWVNDKKVFPIDDCPLIPKHPSCACVYLSVVELPKIPIKALEVVD